MMFTDTPWALSNGLYLRMLVKPNHEYGDTVGLALVVNDKASKEGDKPQST